MRCLALPALVLVLSLASGSPAGARPVGFTGTLTIDLLFPFGSAIHYAATGQGVANVTVSGGRPATVALPVSAFVASTSMAISDLLLAPISGQALQLANDAGAFVRQPPPTSFTAPGRLGGAMPLRGVARVCLFGLCSSTASVISLPLSPIGAGGIRTGSAPLIFTIAGSPWTTGPVYIPGQGFVTGSSTPSVLSLVTPIFISTANLPPDLAFVPAVGRLRLEFAEPIPEPGTLALLGGGAAALASGVWRLGKRSA